MATRRPHIGGNWKMNLHRAPARALAERLKADLAGVKAEVTVFPAFPYLADVADVLKGSAIKVGAQDAYDQPDGAFTGEVSLAMLRDVGCSVILVGHSERRHVIGESDLLVNRKVRAALKAGFDVILAIGETLDQRQLGQTDAINAAQLSYGLAGVSVDDLARVTIAYEPVWAIGTGQTATPDDAQQAHAAARCHLAGMFGTPAAETIRIQYGGSMKPSNAAELLAQRDIDGGLIGGAALKAEDFTAIVKAAG